MAGLQGESFALGLESDMVDRAYYLLQVINNHCDVGKTAQNMRGIINRLTAGGQMLALLALSFQPVVAASIPA